MNIVYTAILGQCDSLKPAPTGADQCVCFVDDPKAYPDPMGWELRKYLYTFEKSDPRREAWHLRCVPHLLFLNYSRVIWIDASFTLTNLPALLRDSGDAWIAALPHHSRSSCFEEAREIVKVGQAPAKHVDPQMAQYRRERFHPQALHISCVIVRDRSERAAAFGEHWDQEITKHPGDNTQLSLDYCVWKQGGTIRTLRGVRKNNPYAVHDHADHNKRRQPYLVPA